MNRFFEAKVKYETIDEQTGKQRKVNLPYLVDAVSYTEAEARIHKEMEQYVSGEFSVDSIKKVKYTDLFLFDDGDKYYECTVKFISIDQDAGKEKKVINKALVLASDLDEAKKRMDESMSGMTVDYDIISVKETKIADVFIYEAEEESGIKAGSQKASDGKLIKEYLIYSANMLDEHVLEGDLIMAHDFLESRNYKSMQ